MLPLILILVVALLLSARVHGGRSGALLSG